MNKNEKGKAVLVTTEFKGVFFGYLEGRSENSVTLKNARNCIYWPAANNGFLGLANMGPLAGSKIGPRADIELMKPTCIADATPESVELWEEFK